MFSRFGIPAAGLAVLLLSLAGCGNDSAAKPAGPAAAIPVTTQRVQASAWSDTLQGLGTASARESVTLTAKVSEIVDRVHFDSGQQVTAGQTLITLRGDAQQAALAQAQAAHVEADQLFRRQSELADQQLIARSALDTQRSLRDAAAARVAQMRSDIGDRSVRAPFSGVLGLRQVSPGSLITPTTAIATLDDISRMYVDFQVPESALASVAPGDAVSAVGAAYPGRRFEGQVQTIDARINPDTRAVTVRAEFPNPDGSLRPGMLMDVRLYRPERQALVIPEISVVQVGRDSFVFRVKPDDSVEQARVVTGVRRDGKVEITEGLAAGDRIVVDGTGKLRTGVKVAEAAPRPAAPAAAEAQADAPAAPAGS